MHPLEQLGTKARLFNTSAQTADSDVLSADITPDSSPSTFRVTIALDSASTVKLVEDVSGTTETYNLNNGAQLDANDLHSFDVPVRDSGSYNIQLGSGVAIQVLNVDEIKAGVA